MMVKCRLAGEGRQEHRLLEVVFPGGDHAGPLLYLVKQHLFGEGLEERAVGSSG